MTDASTAGSSGATGTRVLVTGATGFLARHLLPRLDRPFGLVRSLEAWNALPHRPELGEVEPIVGSIESPEAWADDPRLGEVGCLVHLAALVEHRRRKDSPLHRINVDGTLALVRVAAKLRARLVFVSTSGTVGCFRSPDQVADEDSPYCEDLVRDWPYYYSKIEAERAASALAKELGVDLVIVRIPVLLGPGDHRGRSVSHIVRLMRGRLPFLIPGGIAYVDVRDVAQGLAAIARRATFRPIYHLAGSYESTERFFGTCAELAGVPMPKRRLAPWLALSAARLLDGVTRLWGGHSPLPDPVVVEMAAHYWGFVAKYADELDYRPRPARETLADTIAWLRQNGLA